MDAYEDVEKILLEKRKRLMAEVNKIDTIRRGSPEALRGSGEDPPADHLRSAK